MRVPTYGRRRRYQSFFAALGATASRSETHLKLDNDLIACMVESNVSEIAPPLPPAAVLESNRDSTVLSMHSNLMTLVFI